MPQNLELKAEVSSLGSPANIAKRIGARYAGTLRQSDSYFRVKHGRLKLRETGRGKSELIFYRRPDRTGSRVSKYFILPMRNAKKARTMLSSLFVRTVVVKKTRRLFLYKNARIHLDVVQGLGRFIEFEVVVTQGPRQADRLMKFLRKAFQIPMKRTVHGSYGDLLVRRVRFPRQPA